jgi:ABC-type polar amino acid transport system ATPase subunit
METIVLRIQSLHVHRGARPVLRGVNLQAARGELVALMGASGSGKTTVLRACAGLDAFQAGRIWVGAVTLHANTAVAGETARLLRRQVGIVFQFHCLFEHLTAIDNVCLAPVHAHGAKPQDARRRGAELLAAFGVEHRAQALPSQLSGGEAQRVAIARALAVDPPVLLMDEPTASLDRARRVELGELLQGLQRQGRTLIIATHDEEFARERATRIVRMESGLVIS